MQDSHKHQKVPSSNIFRYCETKIFWSKIPDTPLPYVQIFWFQNHSETKSFPYEIFWYCGTKKIHECRDTPSSINFFGNSNFPKHPKGRLTNFFGPVMLSGKKFWTSFLWYPLYGLPKFSCPADGQHRFWAVVSFFGIKLGLMHIDLFFPFHFVRDRPSDGVKRKSFFFFLFTPSLSQAWVDATQRSLFILQLQVHWIKYE